MYYKYKINYYESYNDEEVLSEGLVWGKDYGEAANTVVNDYGESSVIDVYLQEIYDEGSYITKADIDYAFREG